MEQSGTSLESFIYAPDTDALILRKEDLTQEFLEENPQVRVGKVLPNNLAIVYVRHADAQKITDSFQYYVHNMFPLVLGLLDEANLDAAGITQVHRQPFYDLQGNGVLLGFVDTGIDYKHPAFLYEDGTSKIQFIWDQTIPGDPPESYFYGSEYTKEEINAALRSENPSSAVPHKDTVGHGTFLASVAGGREKGEYIGAAPDAQIIAVKLKKARNSDCEHYLIPHEQENAYSSDDVIMGIQYIVDKALELERPVAICVALGTNLGSHNGFDTLEDYLTEIAGISGVAICAAAGNESNAGHHIQRKIDSAGESKKIEVRTGKNNEDILITMWNYASDRLSVSVTSPTGEHIYKSPTRPYTTYQYKLVLERSTVIVEYYYPVLQSGEQVTRIKLINATPGLWTITVHGDVILDGIFHAWLPITGFVDPDTKFLEPVPNYTVVTPASAFGIITCGAYDGTAGALAVSSSWGPTRLPAASPDLVAPGVNVGGASLTGHGTMSGTSVSAAITAGACALLLQWGIVEKNDVSLNSFRIRANLIGGCERDENLSYPNNQWGYGKLNLLKTFRALSSG